MPRTIFQEARKKARAEMIEKVSVKLQVHSDLLLLLGRYFIKLGCEKPQMLKC
jgi:hypothetical protein